MQAKRAQHGLHNMPGTWQDRPGPQYPGHANQACACQQGQQQGSSGCGSGMVEQAFKAGVEHARQCRTPLSAVLLCVHCAPTDMHMLLVVAAPAKLLLAQSRQTACKLACCFRPAFNGACIHQPARDQQQQSATFRHSGQRQACAGVMVP